MVNEDLFPEHFHPEDKRLDIEGNTDTSLAAAKRNSPVVEVRREQKHLPVVRLVLSKCQRRLDIDTRAGSAKFQPPLGAFVRIMNQLR